MSVQAIRLYNFRNLADGTIELPAKVIFLVGENGAGKSNFLESLYYLSYASSFRDRIDEHIVKDSNKEMSLSGTLSGVDKLVHNIDIQYKNKSKSIRINDKILTDRKPLIYISPAIVFCHSDIAYIKGQPQQKRFFFNQTSSLSDTNFIDLLRTYEHCLAQRNSVLKQGTTELLAIFDQHLASIGLVIQKQRQSLIKEFNEFFTPFFREVTGSDEPCYIEYQASWKNHNDEAAICEFLRNRREQDLQQLSTTSGPHRDNFIIKQDKKRFVDIASTGQLRLASLILKTSQASYLLEKTRRKLTFLLDDVLLELDRQRKEKFLAMLPEFEQIFFTFLPREDTSNLFTEDTLKFTVKDGLLTAS